LSAIRRTLKGLSAILVIRGNAALTKQGRLIKDYLNSIKQMGYESVMRITKQVLKDIQLNHL